MNFADSLVLLLSAAILIAAAQLLLALLSNKGRAGPTRQDILARFDYRPHRMWAAVGLLGLVDASLLTLGARSLTGRSLGPLGRGFGAHDWALGIAFLATACVLSVVLVAVVITYGRAE